MFSSTPNIVTYECESSNGVIENEFKKYDCGPLVEGSEVSIFFGKKSDGGLSVFLENTTTGEMLAFYFDGALKSDQTVSEDEQCWYDDYSPKYEFKNSNGAVSTTFECLEYFER